MQLATREVPEQAVPDRKVPKLFAHQPALDGLRGLAVVAVLLHHQGFDSGRGFGRGGFLGVDIFFVLSGYLITSLLLIDHATTGHVVSMRFWARRARRLFPALLVLLLMVAAYAAFVAQPYDFQSLRGSALATLFYVNNFWLMRPTNRYGPWLLSHTWSLSIEEQFYLVWPILLAVMVRFARGRKAALLAMFGALAAVSVGLMVATFGPDTGRADLGTDTRAHSLLVGAALAVLLLGWNGPVTRRARIALEVGGIAAFAFLLWMLDVVDFYGSAWLYHGGFLVIAIASAVLIAASVQRTSPVVRNVLSVRPLTAIGLISYGLYLYHWPIYVWLSADRVGFDGISLFALRIAVTFAVAIASYFLVERPIRRGALSWRRMRVIAPAAVAAVVALLLVATMGAEPVAFAASDHYYTGLRKGARPGAVRVLVVGDAVAFSLGNATGGSFHGDGIVGTTAADINCGIGSGRFANTSAALPKSDCNVWPDALRNGMRWFKPDVSVLMLGTTTVFDRVVDGRRIHAETPEFAAYLLNQLTKANAILTAHGTQLVILTTPCTAASGASGPDDRRVDWLNSVFQRFAAQHPASVHVGDYAGFICPGGSPRVLAEGQPPRWANGGPVEKAGAIATWQWLAGSPLIAERVRAAQQTH